MQRLSESQRKSLGDATSRYHKQLTSSEAADYLNQRGLDPEQIKRFKLGYVHDPLPEHEPYRGMLAIPYIRRHPRHGWCVVNLRFRAINPEQTPKYKSTPGAGTYIYNTLALTTPTDEVGICEGEIDAITASLCGMPTVGIPGANTWKPYWSELFNGYSRVWVFTDGDEPGTKLGNELAQKLGNAIIIPAGDGEDLNSEYQKHGAEYIKKKWSKNE